MPVSASSSSTHSPLTLPSYRGKAGRYDECFDAEGRMRPHWETFFSLLGSNPAGALKRASDACRRAILEQDVSMNVYSGERSAAQPWPLDALPLVISTEDWDAISRGLRQRAHLYNALLQDVYGPQKLLRQGAMPAALAMANPHYQRACAGLGKIRSPFLHTYAVDLARSPDGQWWVLEDRLDAPSGLGYSLQNRIIVRQALPEVFQRAPVHRLYQFFHDFRTSLEQSTPRHEDPRVVFLTPGPANEIYFEHAYLARYLGYPLVEGADLTTRDQQVFLRTVGGLKRVDTIVRRLDSAFCDPLEMNERSLLGVPGLVQAAHAGRVMIANQLGGGALESTAMLSFLAPLCREVLCADLELPSVATWWCGQEKARIYVLENLATLVIKSAFRSPDAPATRYGAALSEEELTKLADEIRARPWAYCGQERVLLGTTPALTGQEIHPVPFVVRVYLVWKDGEYHAMPGGLTRFNPTGEDAIFSLRQGSVTKDTWVFSDRKVEQRPIQVVPQSFAVQRAPAATPSRVADNLFWLGRYLERTSQLARMLGKLDPLLHDEVGILDPEVASDAATLLIASQDSIAPRGASPEALATQARKIAHDPAHLGSLAANLTHLLRIMEQVKVRLPPEAWRILRSLRGTLESGDSVKSTSLREQLTALEALSVETLPHDTGWRFLELGRRIERGQQLLFLLRRLGVSGEENEFSEFRLQTLLHFADSLFMYRSLYHGIFEPVSVLGWLIGGEENPRGLRYQADQINQHLEILPNDLSPHAVAGLRQTAFRLLSLIRLVDAAALTLSPRSAQQFFTEAVGVFAELSEKITQIYFTHAELPVRP